MNKSVQTINSPEFINLQPLDLNPLMSACEIKVLYIGENRNHSYITKDVATEMAKTLRGAPIVGYWKKDVEDFGDHGHRVVIDDDGIKFESTLGKVKLYGSLLKLQFLNLFRSFRLKLGSLIGKSTQFVGSQLRLDCRLCLTITIVLINEHFLKRS